MCFYKCYICSSYQCAQSVYLSPPLLLFFQQLNKPLWLLAFSTSSCQTSLFLAFLNQFVILVIFISSNRSSTFSQIFLQHSFSVVGICYNFRILLPSIMICPNHLNLCPFTNLTISVRVINVPNPYIFFLILLLSCYSSSFINLCAFQLSPQVYARLL